MSSRLIGVDGIDGIKKEFSICFTAFFDAF
jgi:hypothetical protein